MARAIVSSTENLIALDPNYALAYTGIATGLFMLSAIAVAKLVKSLTEAKHLLEKAVALDAELAETRVLLGAVRVCLDYDWKGAEREFQQALAAETVSAECLDTYGRGVLWPQGRFEEALSVNERAHKLEPLIPTFAYRSAEVFVCTGEYDKSIQQCHRALEIESGRAEDVADAVLFLMKNGFVTGITLTIDRGGVLT